MPRAPRENERHLGGNYCDKAAKKHFSRADFSFCRSCAGARAPQDLPDTLKQVATEAVKTIWQAANEAATGQLATLCAESPHAASAAEAGQDTARAETSAAR